MIDRLKPSLKVLTASVGFAALGLAGAGLALADDDERIPKPRPEAVSGEDERSLLSWYVTASNSDDGAGWYVGLREANSSDDGDDERLVGLFCKRSNTC